MGRADLRAVVPPVVTAIKADMRCAAVAAASILAKTSRDALMVELAKSHPGYGWHENKGYASPEHIEALRVLGPCAVHRRSWSLPGIGPSIDPMQQDERRPGLRFRNTCNDTFWGELMSVEDLDKYEADMELALYREYRDVVAIFKYVVETDRRFYLCNAVDVKVRSETGDAYFEVTLTDAWVWDIYRPARFAKNVKVLTFKDVNVEELQDSDLAEKLTGPDGPAAGSPTDGPSSTD